MTDSLNQTVLITGASSGIGLALARDYLINGARVFVLARSQDKLNGLAREFPASCIPIPVDLTDKKSSQQAADLISAQTQHLDLAILNAGTCEYVDVNHFRLEPFNKVMAINWQGTLNSLTICLPLLRNMNKKNDYADQRSQLVVVSSMASLLPMPRSQAYGASKIALEYLFNSLRVDMAQEPIDITIIRPGFVKTPLTDRNDFAMPFALSAEKAVSIMVKGIAARKWIIQFPLPLVFIMRMLAFMPLKIQTWVLQKLSRASH
jgi:short-subunit dehydrogenase